MLEPTRQLPLRRFPLVDTTDPEEFHHLLTHKFGAGKLDLGASPAGFRAQRRYLKMPNLDLIFGTCTVPYKVEFRASDLIKQHFALRKQGRTHFRGTQFNISRDETAVIPAGIDMIHEYEADFEQLIFRVDAAALQAKLSAIAGIAIARTIEFSTRAQFVNPGLQRLRRMLEYMIGELDREGEKIPPAALEEFEQLLIVGFLTAHPHNFTDLLERDQPRPAPWQVRRVEDYIEANWHKPITVDVLAEAAGASTRSVFKAFREARKCSPMAFVKSIRLSHARRMLQRPEQSTSVVSVAYSCGFLNPGHFARDYRLAFGELPSATLALARHQRL